MSRPKFDPRRSLVALDQHKSIIAVVELSLKTWLVGAIVPGIARDPLKKLTTPDPEALLRLLYRWRSRRRLGGLSPAWSLATKLVATGSGSHDG